MATDYLKRAIETSYFLPYIIDSATFTTQEVFVKVCNILKMKYYLKHKRSKSSKKESKPITEGRRHSISEKPLKQEENPETQKEKAKEIKKLLKKLQKEKSERHRKLQEMDEEAKRKLDEDLELEEILKQKREEELKKERINNTLKRREKEEKHKKEFENWKNLTEKEYKNVLSQKYMHEKIEESYITQVVMPELEKKKAELAQKRLLFQPINRGEINEHARRHDEIIKDLQARREKEALSQSIDFQYHQISKSFHSKAQDALKEEEKRQKEEKDKEEMEKKQRIEKKHQYAELVKELYRPTVDEFKRQEMKLLVEKLKLPVRQKLYGINSANTDEVSTANGSVTEKHRRKWSKNPMVPEPPQKKDIKKIDFLAEMRIVRRSQGSVTRKYDLEKDLMSYDHHDEEKTQKLKEKTNLVDKEISRKERILSSKLDHPKSIDFADELNDMIISSIKAKLAIVNASVDLS